MSSKGPKEELLGLLPLSGQTRGEDEANTAQKCLEDNGIDINKIISIATDGVRSMTGIHRGVEGTQEQGGIIGGPEMHSYRATQMDSSKRNSASCGPHIRRME
ncbi:hypothetical protein HNY73_019394 [Argiope bruennichi]|uniref:Uncharacterized protein n=1 Tax=Argiope bruennichi TaxID=94029 RepID=A0A8T0EH58_ARGBR|nr:hypothetical protein HNY73_019394 [Argiope bruennichi]